MLIWAQSSYPQQACLSPLHVLNVLENGLRFHNDCVGAISRDHLCRQHIADYKNVFPLPFSRVPN